MSPSDWRLRSELTKRGIIRRVSRQCQRRGSASLIYEGLTDLSLAFDFRPQFHWRGNFFVRAYQIHGKGLTAANIDNLNTISGIEATATTRLFELVRAAYRRLAADPDWPAKRGTGISGHHRGQALRQLGLWLADFAAHGFTVRRPELSAGAQTSTPDNHTFSRRICPIG
jgi:hypothetical protein